ncbi:MAG: oligosaccharide flippase family protein [Polyangiaceae bacterium]
MSLARDTVRGALWTILAGLGSRGVGLLGTLVVTHYVSPEDYGEVMVAAILAMTANQVSTLGLGQYLVSKPDAHPSAPFVANVLHVLLGVLAVAAVVAFGPRIGAVVDAPGLTRYLGGLAVAVLFDRASFVPERLLARDLRFGTLGLGRTLGDLAHTLTAVLLVIAGFGAMSLVLGNVVRSALRLLLFGAAAGARAFLLPRRPTLPLLVDMFGFGIPVAIGALAAFATRRWDNLLVSRYFGPAVTGMYNLAYNLADVPAIHVGEQIGDVLLPSFARLPDERRPAALLRALALLSLVVFPMAVGLGVIAPTLVSVVFDPRWRPVAPMLLVLSVLSIARPVAWVIASYAQALGRPRPLMWLELAKLLGLGVAIASVGRTSPVGAAAAVGAVYVLHALACLWVAESVGAVELRRSLASLVPACVATLPLALAVLGARASWRAAGGSAGPAALGLEIAAGVVAYVVGAWLFARSSVLDLLSRFREALGADQRAQRNPSRSPTS